MNSKNRIELLKTKPIRNLLLGNLITVGGGAMSYIALTWYVLQLRNSLTSIVILAICFWLPSVIIAPFAGYLIDRFNRKKTYIACIIIRALSVFIIAITIVTLAKTNTEKLYLCYLLNLITGVIFTFIMPASVALTREIVSDKDLLNANSMIDMSFEIGNVAGMGFTTIFLVTVGAVNCLFITAAIMMTGAIMMSLVKVYREHHTGKTENNALSEIIIGFKFLKNNKYLLFLNLSSIALMVQFMITPVLLAPFVKNILHGPAREFSAIECSLSVGLVLGSLIIPILVTRFRWYKICLIATVALGICYYYFGINRYFPLALLIYAALGLFLSIWSVIASKAQAVTPKAMQGRIMTSTGMLASFCILTVYVLLQLVSKQTNLVTFYDWSALLSIACFIFLLLAAGQGNHDALDSDQPRKPPAKE